LAASGFYRTEGIFWDETAYQGEPFKYFVYGAAVAEVEVDGFTGMYSTRRVDVVHDAGDSLSPLVDLGQIEGAFVQGAGWLTLEDQRWDTGDGPTRGRFATQAASTYKLPSFSEMPDVFNVTMLADAREDGAVYGSKAVGEPPLMLPFTVREALRSAAAAFGPAGIAVELASPATPEAVYWAVEQARAGGCPVAARYGVAAQDAAGANEAAHDVAARVGAAGAHDGAAVPAGAGAPAGAGQPLPVGTRA
jgi:xanthine dehydrogenase large subunit